MLLNPGCLSEVFADRKESVKKRKVINIETEFTVVKEMSKRHEEKKTLHGDKNSARILNRADFKREMKNYIHPSDA